MKQTPELLGKLTAPGVKLADSQGIAVAPRYRMKITTWPKLVALREQMQPFEERRLGRLKKEYRRLRSEIQFLCDGFLREHLDYFTI